MIAIAGRLQNALEDQVTAGASGTLARIEAPRAGIDWAGSTGPLAEGEERVPAAGRRVSHCEHLEELHRHVVVRLSRDGKLGSTSLSATARPELLERWRSLSALPATTPRQLLAHTSGIPNYFGEEAFFAGCRTSRAAHGIRSSSSTMSRRAAVPQFLQERVQLLGHWLRSGRVLMEQVTGRPLHEVYREIVFGPLGMGTTWLEGHEPALAGRGRAPLPRRHRHDDALADDRLGGRRPGDHGARPGRLRARPLAGSDPRFGRARAD